MDFSSLESKFLNQLKETDDVIRVHTVGEQSREGRLADLQVFRFRCLWRISLFALQWGLECCMLTLLAPTDLYQGEHTYASRRQTRNRNLEIQSSAILRTQNAKNYSSVLPEICCYVIGHQHAVRWLDPPDAFFRLLLFKHY